MKKLLFILLILIVPVIVNANELDDPIVLTAEEINEIILDSEGANTTYTWYISDSRDGNFEKLEVVQSSKYKLIPTLELNGKYVKCGIKKNGEEEYFTNVAKLEVIKNPSTDTGVAIVIIFVVCSLVFFILLRKFVLLKR